MSNITISLNKIQNTKKVNIGNDTYSVRVPGGAESLDLSSNNRQQGETLKALVEIQSALAKTDIKDDEVNKLSEKADVLLDKLNSLRENEINFYKEIITDDDGGKKTNKLLRTLSSDGMRKIIELSFGE